MVLIITIDCVTYVRMQR